MPRCPEFLNNLKREKVEIALCRSPHTCKGNAQRGWLSGSHTYFKVQFLESGQASNLYKTPTTVNHRCKKKSICNALTSQRNNPWTMEAKRLNKSHRSRHVKFLESWILWHMKNTEMRGMLLSTALCLVKGVVGTHTMESLRIQEGDRNIKRSSQCLKFRDMSRHKRSSGKEPTSAIDYFNSMAGPISGRLILAGIRNFRQI